MIMRIVLPIILLLYGAGVLWLVRWWGRSHREPCDDLVTFADGELPPDQADEFRDHLPRCARCGADLEEAMQLGARLSTLAPKPRDPR